MPTDLTPSSDIEDFLAATDAEAGAQVLSATTALRRQFRVLNNEDAVAYTDGGIGFGAENSWVSLPNPDEAKIGAAFVFFGRADGVSCGFYVNSGNDILLLDDTATDYFTVPAQSRVLAQLDSYGKYRVTVLQDGKCPLGSVGGSVTLNAENGPFQWIYELTDDTTFSISNGKPGDTLTLEIQWAGAARNINFSGIKMPAAASALLPFTLPSLTCITLDFRHVGGGWAMGNENSENVD